MVGGWNDAGRGGRWDDREFGGPRKRSAARKDNEQRANRRIADPWDDGGGGTSGCRSRGGHRQAWCGRRVTQGPMRYLAAKRECRKTSRARAKRGGACRGLWEGGDRLNIRGVDFVAGWCFWDRLDKGAKDGKQEAGG
jgi:hypothetical protein